MPPASATAEGERASVRKSLRKAAFWCLVVLAVSLGSAGQAGWPHAWTLAAMVFATQVYSVFAVSHRHPGLLEERARRHANTKRWDILLLTVFLLTSLATWCIAGLDRRWSWTPPLPVWAVAGAFSLMASGYVFSTWAMQTNAFFSATVRIQQERGHRVCDSGPYRYLRHPAYAGWMLAGLFMPVALNSLPAAIPAGLGVALFAVRAALEDRALQAELPGYREYAARVRSRLIPGLW